MSTATACACEGCSRRTRAGHGYCWQHSDMAAEMTLDAYLAYLFKIRERASGTTKVVVRGQKLEPPAAPLLVTARMAAGGLKTSQKFADRPAENVVCLN